MLFNKTSDTITAKKRMKLCYNCIRNKKIDNDSNLRWVSDYFTISDIWLAADVVYACQLSDIPVMRVIFRNEDNLWNFHCPLKMWPREITFICWYSCRITAAPLKTPLLRIQFTHKLKVFRLFIDLQLPGSRNCRSQVFESFDLFNLVCFYCYIGVGIVFSTRTSLHKNEFCFLYINSKVVFISFLRFIYLVY